MIAALVALLASFLATWVLRYGAPYLGAVAQKDPHVVTHTTPTPLLGGVGILAGLAAAIGVQRLAFDETGFLILLIPLAALGLAKDTIAKSLAPIPQLVVEVLAAILVLAWTMRPEAAGALILIPGTVLIAAFVNAVNFIDVSDGLAGTVTAIICAVSAIMMSMLALPQMAQLAAVFACAILGFLAWNRPKAFIFMGDAGAFAISAVIAFILLQAWRHGAPLAVLALICSVPFGELAFTIIARIVHRRSPFRGDARHLSLTLLNRGWSAWSILLLYAAATLATGLAALILLSKSHLP